MPCFVNHDPNLVIWYKFSVSCGSPENFPFVDVALIDSTPTLDPDQPDELDPRWASQPSYARTSGQCDPFYFYYALAGPGSGQNVAWLGCDESSMDLPWIELELTL